MKSAYDKVIINKTIRDWWENLFPTFYCLSIFFRIG